MAFNYTCVLQVADNPTALGCFFRLLSSPQFLSVFETVLDALFLCFAVDLETNDEILRKALLYGPRVFGK